MRLRDKIAVVTGAGAGIGKAIALRLASEGATVVVGEINSDSGKETERLLREQFGKGLFIQTDVSVPRQTQRLIETTVAEFQRLDTLVNNAGINFVKPTLEVTEEDWERVLGVDLDGTFFCSLNALRVMTRQKSGSIINIASVHSVATIAGAAPYAAAKAAVVQLTRALAVEFSALGIRINCVSPGAVATQIMKEAEAAAPNLREHHRHWLSHIAMGRVGEPEEIAGLVAFLASDEASYVTGSNIFVDGGMTSMLTGIENYEPAP